MGAATMYEEAMENQDNQLEEQMEDTRKDMYLSSTKAVDLEDTGTDDTDEKEEIYEEYSEEDEFIDGEEIIAKSRELESEIDIDSIEECKAELSEWLINIRGIVEELVEIEEARDKLEITSNNYQVEMECLVEKLAEIQEEQAKIENEMREYSERYLNLKLKLRKLSSRVD